MKRDDRERLVGQSEERIEESRSVSQIVVRPSKCSSLFVPIYRERRKRRRINKHSNSSPFSFASSSLYWSSLFRSSHCTLSPSIIEPSSHSFLRHLPPPPSSSSSLISITTISFPLLPSLNIVATILLLSLRAFAYEYFDCSEHSSLRSVIWPNRLPYSSITVSLCQGCPSWSDWPHAPSRRSSSGPCSYPSGSTTLVMVSFAPKFKFKYTDPDYRFLIFRILRSMGDVNGDSLRRFRCACHQRIPRLLPSGHDRRSLLDHRYTVDRGYGREYRSITGNACAIPIINRLGMAMGILIWNTGIR